MRLASLAVLAVAAVLFPLAACGSETDADTDLAGPDGSSTTKKPGPGSSSSSGSPGDEDGGTNPDPTNCPRTPKAPDRLRKAIVSLPYTADAKKANLYEVLDYTTSGELKRIGQTFQMHRSLDEIVFTPDGEIGLTAQDDGTLGVFKIDANGAVTVVHAGFKGAFYAAHVVMSHDGKRAFVLDRNTKDNRGGVYEVSIACDGTLTDKGMVVPGGKAHAMALIPTDPQKAVLIAGGAFDSPADDYSHRIDFAPAIPVRLAGAPVFGDQNAIASGVAVTLDGKWALVTDNGLTGGNRMAPVEVATMKSGAAIPVSNPAGVVMSPFGNALLLMESDSTDHLQRVTYDASNSTAPFAVANEIAYVGGKTSLPVLATTIGVGTLKGRVLVSENDGVRQLAFDSGGNITDLGKLNFGGEIKDIVGALGVQP